MRDFSLNRSADSRPKLAYVHPGRTRGRSQALSGPPIPRQCGVPEAFVLVQDDRLKRHGVLEGLGSRQIVKGISVVLTLHTKPSSSGNCCAVRSHTTTPTATFQGTFLAKQACRIREVLLPG